MAGKAVYYGDEALLELRPGQRLSGDVHFQSAARIREDDVTSFTSRGVFLLAYLLTQYVSLGSILMALLLIIQVFVFNGYGILGLYGSDATEFNLLIFILGAMAIIRHKDNLVRLFKGTENKIGKKPEISMEKETSQEQQ